jgi:hypothetical protein
MMFVSQHGGCPSTQGGTLTTVRVEVPAVKNAERIAACLVLRPPKLPINVQHRILLVS